MNSLLKKQFLLLLITGVIASLISCNNDINDGHTWRTYLVNSDTIPQGPDSLQLIVLRKPNTTDADLTKWIDSVAGQTKMKIYLACKDCDSSLLLLMGDSVTTIQHAIASGGSGKPSNPVGDGGAVYYSLNYKVEFKDPVQGEAYPNIKDKYEKVKPIIKSRPDVVVAVFDTGIDSSSFTKSAFYTGNIIPCMGPHSKNGWNFSSTPQDSIWQDDYPEQHGTRVSRLLVNEVNAIDGNGIKILPVKIHNSSGEGRLYNVLCGFAYAAQQGVQIINASFGYEVTNNNGLQQHPDRSQPLLKAFVQKYLTSNNILLIAAAGNQALDLDKNSFYPASLARDPDMTNVIAVTTVNVDSARVSPDQNYSPNVVDFGVQANAKGSYRFIDPLVPFQGILGSSYATPIVTGTICANYYRFMANTAGAAGVAGLTKQNIISVLLQNQLVSSVDTLKPFIRNGIVTTVKANYNQR